MNIKSYWSALLLFEILFLVFFVGFLPSSWNAILIPILYSVLYLTAAFGLERYGKIMLRLGFVMLFTQLAVNWLNLTLAFTIFRGLNIIFFAFIVILVISQIAKAREVNARVILDATNGYLLLGLVFALLVDMMIMFDSQAFNFTVNKETNLQDNLYFSFVTLATLGYGDFVPIKPYAKSLSMLIAVCGQLYVAIIIALLVGKFSSRAVDN